MEEIGPGGSQAGRIVGLVPALHALGDIGGPLLAAGIGAGFKLRDFNDAEAPPITGASRGKIVPPRGQPPTWNPRGPSPIDPDDDLYARTKGSGKENRAYYRRTMGTAKRRPRNEQPFGPAEEGTAHPPKHIDTSNIRNAGSP
jgi:hypothetical protein